MSSKQVLDLNKFLPKTLRTDELSSIISNLFNKFTSKEDSITINGTIGSPSNITGQVVNAPDLEHEINELIPGVYSKTATVESLYTFNDMVNKLNVLDCNTDDLHSTLTEQYYNLHVPINYDKFINFENYFWAGGILNGPNTFQANPNNDPLYYVIARPSKTSQNKGLVSYVFTRDIKLTGSDRLDENISITFTSATDYVVSTDNPVDNGIIIVNTTNSTGPSTGSLINSLPSVATNVTLYVRGLSIANYGIGKSYTGTEPNDAMLSFTITNGNRQFTIGDKFIISVHHRTNNMNVKFISSVQSEKGNITNILSLLPMMYVNEGTAQNPQLFQLAPRDFILAIAQNDPSQNGIYVVNNGSWAKAPNSLDSTYWPVNSKVYVTKTNTSYTLVNPTLMQFTQDAIPFNNLNGWQVRNFWYHRDDFDASFGAYGITLAQAVQAKRPIIEYNADLSLNTYITGTAPSDKTSSSVAYTQKITEYNQPPQFNLYRYDGTHAGVTSPIFYYVEDPRANVDTVLKRKIKTNSQNDYIFGLGLTDPQNRLYYYNINGSGLDTVWTPGITAPQIISFTRPQIVIDNMSTPGFQPGSPLILNNSADNQTWTLTFNGINFDVNGTRSGNVGIALPGIKFTCNDFSITLPVVNSYTTGDTFQFTIANEIGPRYIKKLDSGQFINYPGGPVGDKLDGAIDGAWATPLRMFQNLMRESKTEISYGDIMSHIQDMIRNQDGISTDVNSPNVLRKLTFNPGLGGKIRDFNQNFPLLTSMLIQDNLSPISIIDFAENQYRLALSSIDKFILNNLVSFLSNGNDLTIDNTDPNAAQDWNNKILSLLNYFEQTRTTDETLNPVFYDSTSGVTNWPITLPKMGLAYAVQPKISFDYELNLNVIVHHDGHESVLSTKNIDLDNMLVDTVATRSDGSKVAGVSYTSLLSSFRPYAQQLWINPLTNELKVFSVNYDTDTAPTTANDGEYWYNRGANTLFKWDNSLSVWVASSDNRWKDISIENIRNSLVLAVEQKLFDNIYQASSFNYAPIKAAIDNKFGSNPLISENELAVYSAKYNYNMYAPDYVQTNAFTWNYANANVYEYNSPNILLAKQARWHKLYKEYFNNPGVTISTDRPDLEPWKLLNISDQSAINTFVSQWKCSASSTQTTIQSVTVASINEISNIVFVTSIDGITLNNGDRVLLQNDANPSINGIYVFRNNALNNTESSQDNSLILSSPENVTVTVLSGNKYANTNWSLSKDSQSNIQVNQIRFWSTAMWDNILTVNPQLKTCVNKYTDSLLPPYVSPNSIVYQSALINAIPTGISNPYTFGDNGPTELLWKKSLEFNYSLSRSAFRQDPLVFITNAWGNNYVSANYVTPRGKSEVKLERNLLAPQSNSLFLLHGDRLLNQNVYTPIQAANNLTFDPTISSNATITLNNIAPGTYTLAFKVAYIHDNLTAFVCSLNDIVINTGVIQEGVSFSLTTPNLSISNLVIEDLGIPFELNEGFSISFTILDTYTLPSVSIILTGNNVTNISSNILPVQIAHIPTSVKTFDGLCQIFTQLLRYNYVDSSISSIVNLYKNWEVKLIHRLGTLIRPETLTIGTTLGNVPESGYSILLKKNPNIANLWISGLRVQLVQLGASVQNEYNFAIPPGDASDWVFRVENYNDQNPSFEIYEYNTNGEFLTFNALNKTNTSRAWNHYTDIVSINTVTAPIIITGLQNTLNFIFGYTDRLYDLGFRSYLPDSPITDPVTGRTLDWQLEIEKFIDQVYRGFKTGDGYILNPFMSNLVLLTDTGVMSAFSQTLFTDVYSMQAAYNVLSEFIPVNNLDVIRTDDNAIIYTNTPIFSAHIFKDSYEHAILFNKDFYTTDNSPITFDFFLDIGISSAQLIYTSQEDNKGKPTFNGFFLNGNTITRNIVSSIDSIANYYDSNKTFLDPVTQQHALALLGYQNKKYFDYISLSENTKFNFWRGLIQAKGTNMAIDAFSNYKNIKDATIDESWAYKIAEYGDARQYIQPELIVNTSDLTKKQLRLQFYDTNDNVDLLQSFEHVEQNDDNIWFSIDDLNVGLHFETNQISESVTVELNSVPFTQTLSDNYNTNNLNDITLPVGITFTAPNIVSSSITGQFTIAQQQINETITVNIDPVFETVYLSNTYDLTNNITILLNGNTYTSAVMLAGNYVKVFDSGSYTITQGNLSDSFTVNLPSPNKYVQLNNIYTSDMSKVHITMSNGGVQVDASQYVTLISPILAKVVASGTYTITQDPLTNIISGTVTYAPAYIKLKNIYYNDDPQAINITKYDTTTNTPHAANQDAVIINSQLLKVNVPGTYIVTGYTWVNSTKFSPIKLIDYKNNIVTNNIQLWHPAIGVHTQAPIDIINIISNNDPALFNYTVQSSNNENYYITKAWAKKEVGRVWWDTSNLEYIPYYDSNIFPSIEARLQRWGILSDWSSVDLYQWTESPVPPSQYNDLAAQQEGSADIDNQIKLSGEVGFSDFYERNRIISITPIAWSHASVPDKNAHPSFGPAMFTPVYVNANLLVPFTGRCEDIGLTVGRHFGGWSVNKPIGEISILDNLSYLIGSTEDINIPVLVPTPGTSTGTITNLSITALDVSSFGSKIGQLTFSKKNVTGTTFSLRLSDDTGTYEDQLIEDWAYSADDALLIVNFNTFGVSLAITRDTSTIVSTIPVFSASDIIDSIVNGLIDVYVREAVQYNELLPLQSTIFANDPALNYSNWRCWDVPSQDDLNNDFASPNNTWLPYLGDPVQVVTTPDLVTTIKAYIPLTTIDNVSISSYSSTWSSWSKLENVKITQISDGINTLQFSGFTDIIDPNRASVYVNGSQINSSSYLIDITNNNITLLNVLPEGYSVLLYYRKYVPTSTELSFDPTISDNILIQNQYKQDYEYTVVQQRDSSGNLTNNLYYFWVKNKIIPGVNKSISLSEAAELLTTGNDTYVTFQHAIPSNGTYIFDACTITGLNNYVTKDDSFKLRFIKDYTLRNDPEELNLKNVHTEWKLIRKNQFTKIPLTLWQLITDAVCGQDKLGNSLPYQTRINYDNKHGTLTRYGFKQGQIFADTDLVKASITNALLNPQVTFKINNKLVTTYINFLDYSQSSTWFDDPQNARLIMDKIYSTAHPLQINEIFFDVLNDALASDYEFTDIFKTSFITVGISGSVTFPSQQEIIDEFY